MTNSITQPNRFSAVSSFFKSLTRKFAEPQAPAMFESLEGRQMMSGGIFFFTATTKLADRTFLDNNGNKVVFTLTGPGLGTLVQDDLGNFSNLELDGTSSTKSSLSITVIKGKGSLVDSTLIGDIDINDSETADGGLISFTGAKVNLDSSFNSEGVVKALTLNDIGDGVGQAGIHIAGPSAAKITLNFAKITDALITTTAGINTFRALDWQDTNDSIDALEANTLTSITITGRAANAAAKIDKLNGDLEANIDLTYSPPMSSTFVPLTTVSVAGSAHGAWDFRNNKANSINIKGDVNESTWNSLPGFGAITIGGTTTNLDITTHKDIQSINGGSFNHVSLDTIDSSIFGNIGSIGTITVLDWNHGHIYSGKVGSLTTLGRVGSKTVEAIHGDFSASMLIVGISERPNAITMGPINIKGDAVGFGAPDEGPEWHFVGGVSSIIIRGDMRDLGIQADFKGGKAGNIGNIASLQVFGDVTDSSIWLAGKIGTVTVGNATAFSIEATSTFKLGSIGNFTAKDVVDTSLKTTGTIGAIRVNSANNFDVEATGNIASYTSTGAVTNDSKVEAGANLGAVSIGSSNQFNIHIAGALTSFTSKGSVMDSAIDGVTSGKNFGAISVGSARHFDIHSHGNVASFVSKGDVFGSTIGALGTLGNVTVSGELEESFIEVAGKSAGVISVYSVINSAVFIGTLLEEPFSELPTKLSQFKNFGTGAVKSYSTLAGFIVTGKNATGNSFVNSRIAAGTLTNVSLKLIDGEEPADNGFAAGVRIGSYIRYTGPTAVGAVRVNNKTAPGTYDPTGGGVGIVGYKLTIVAPLLGGAAL